MKRYPNFCLRACCLIFGMLFAACTAAPAVEAAPPVTKQPIEFDEIAIEAVTAEPMTPVPTPEPTPTPTPSPTPEPTEEPTPEPMRITAEMLEEGMVDSYFDNAVFVGDSLTRSLSNFVREKRQRNKSYLGGAQFLGTVSMSVKIASTDRANPGGVTFYFRGNEVSVTEGIKGTGAKKVFILLGTNDLGYRKWDVVEQEYAKLIDVILEKCRDTRVIVLGVLPVTAQFCKNNKVKIEKWNTFNDTLKTIAEEHGATFYSFAQDLMDQNGYLKKEYAEGSFHLQEKGELVWIRAMRIFAAQELYPDAILEIQ